MTQRCPRCGHNFYNDSPLSDERCHYCHSDDKSSKQYVYKEYRNPSDPICPKCGSKNFISATKVEECPDCDYSQSYW